MFSRLLNSHHHPITYSFIMSELSFSVGVIWKDSEYNVPQQASLEENLSLYPRNGMVWTVASKRKCFPWRNKAIKQNWSWVSLKGIASSQAIAYVWIWN